MTKEQFAPWITDPDDPADVPSPADPDAAAAAVFAAHPELVDTSLDGPLKNIVKDFEKTLRDAAAEEKTRDPHTQHIIRTFYEAINHIDLSEPVIRDMIESELMDIAGVSGTKVSAAVTAGNNVAKKISALRAQHIKRAFRHLRKHLPSDI